MKIDEKEIAAAVQREIDKLLFHPVPAPTSIILNEDGTWYPSDKPPKPWRRFWWSDCPS